MSYSQYQNNFGQRTKLSEVLSTPTESIISPMDKLLSKFDVMINKITELGEKLEDINKQITISNNLLSEQPELTWTQIEIDSTHRNRKEYPSSSEFVIPFSAQVGTNAFNSQDPVSFGMPFFTGITQPGGDGTTIVLDPSMSTVDNFCVTCIIKITNEYRRINLYMGSTFTATLDQPFSFDTTGGGFQYWLKRESEIFEGRLQPDASNNTYIVTLPSSASNTVNYYRGMWLYIFTGPAAGEYQLITSYDPTNKQVRLNAEFSVYPGDLSYFEINDFSEDNVYPLRYNGTRTINQPVCYAITLITLGIPKLLLDVPPGGYPQDYPFVYVTFNNYNKYSRSILYGNSPEAENVTFKVPLNLTSSTVNYMIVQDPNIGVPQIMKFNPSEPYFFNVTLPNGLPLTFVEKDTQSPYQPNPFVQISAVFAIKRLPTGTK